MRPNKTKAWVLCFAYFARRAISICIVPLICGDDLEGRGDWGIRPDPVFTGGSLRKEEVYINKP